MRILGVHDGHNASACLLEDGENKYYICWNIQKKRRGWVRREEERWKRDIIGKKWKRSY